MRRVGHSHHATTAPEWLHACHTYTPRETLPDMADEPTPAPATRPVPPLHSGVRVQIVSAATIWLVGASIVLVRGFGYVQGRSWIVWALAAGLVLGVLKSRYMLERVATRAVERIRARGPAFFLSFFSLRAWALVAVMMGSGIAIRNVVVASNELGTGILGAVYIGVGTALVLADRVFWHAAFRKPKDAQAAQRT